MRRAMLMLAVAILAIVWAFELIPFFGFAVLLAAVIAFAEGAGWLDR